MNKSDDVKRKKRIEKNQEKRRQRMEKRIYMNENSNVSEKIIHKRILKKRAKRNKNKKMILYGVLILGVLITFISLSMTIFFNIETIEVEYEGALNKYTRDQIIYNSKVSIGDNLWRISKNSISKNIESKLNFVEQVSIKRRLPSTLILSVKEAVPSAYYFFAPKYYLVSENDKILDVVTSTSLEIPIVKGFGQGTEKGAIFGK